MKRGIAHVFAALAGVLLLFALLFASLKVAMNDRNWYLNEYARLGTAGEIGMSHEDVTNALMRLVDYMEGRVDSIDLEVTQHGERVSMYNARESAHMLDVRALYQGIERVALGAAIAAVILFAAAAMLLRRGALYGLARGYVIGACVFAAAVIALGIFALVDFTAFWTAFHRLFFTNDLWLLDPATDRMILICPETLFFDIVLRFGGWFLIAAAALLVLSLLLLGVRRRRRRTPMIVNGGEVDGR